MEKIKIVREALNLKQNEFSAGLGITQSYLSAIETGRKQVTSKLVNTLFKKFNVSPEWFYNNNGDIFNISMGNKNGVNDGENNNYIKSVFLTRDEEGFNEEKDEVTITSDDLNEMIRYKLWYMDFFLIGTLHNLRNYQEKINGIKFDNKSFKQEKAYLRQFERNLENGKPPVYTVMSANEKLKLLKDLEEATKIYLDKIWIISRELYMQNDK